MTFKYRLFFILLLLLIAWLSFPWFVIYYELFKISINIKYVFLLLVFCYLLLEYREYKYPNLYNEFYYFFFWLFYIIIIVTLLLTLVQAFTPILNDIQQSFLNFNYFKITVKYTNNYLLYYAYKYYVVLLTEALTTPDAELIAIFYEIIQGLDFNARITNITTIAELQTTIKAYLELAVNIYFKYTLTVTYYEPDFVNYTSTIFSTFVSIFSFIITCGIVCYTIPKMLIITLPNYLLHNVFSASFKAFAMHTLQERFILDFSEQQIEDLTELFMIWLLKKYPSYVILEEVIKHIFS